MFCCRSILNGKQKEPFVLLLRVDMTSVLADGKKTNAEIVMPIHAGMAMKEFEQIIKGWIATATRHLNTEKFAPT
jgi:hypothetical protein